MQQCIIIFIFPYLYEAKHVSGCTPPIVRTQKLHWQLLVFHTWKVVGRVVGGRCQAHFYLTTHDTHNRQISMPPVGFEPKISAGDRPQCRVLSGRGLCDELITRPEESYRLCCVVVCDLETSRIGAPYIYDISSRRVNTSAHCSGRKQVKG